ncbi:MAG: Stp1/IreP family PP2C-type Ser/Thr phosphatase [Clostridia bacterium]|nr:Stp1/IreP family PP2C-type Ser/Thr phosphatase [Clostridia bacterium]
MKSFGMTDIGLKRHTNQDSYRNNELSDNFVWSLVCDGMGGVNGGDVASSIAVKVIGEYLDENLSFGLDDNKSFEIIKEAFEKANISVFTKASESNEFKGMGTTAVLAVAKGNTCLLAHIGDSRAYLYSDGAVKQVTIDHSLVQNMVNSGQITAAQARVHPQKNIITKSLGVHETVVPECNSIDFKDGDIIVICTDGLGDYLTEEVLLEYIKANPSEKLTDELLKYALRCGGVDNITVTTMDRIWKTI